MSKICPDYCGVACISGLCPIALREELEAREFSAPKNCSDCFYYQGCTDCYFCDNDRYPCPHDYKYRVSD